MVGIHWTECTFLLTQKKLPTKNGRRRWESECASHIYEFDPSHGGEVEVYDRQGYHLGVKSCADGSGIKGPRRGRRIYDV